jgi:hypothetical protein
MRSVVKAFLFFFLFFFFVAVRNRPALSLIFSAVYNDSVS